VSEELRRLAERIASELAARDRAGRGVDGAGTLERPPVARGAPPETENTAGGPESRHHFSAPRAISRHHTAGSAPPGVTFVRENARIADFIDHTLLRAEATEGDIDVLCDEAREHHFATVCVNSVWVAHCARRLAGSGVGVATVVGFPLGAMHTEAKAAETRTAVSHGATEIDMVAAIGHVKGGDWYHVADDIAAVVRAAEGRVVKVIIESAVLTPVEIVKTCALAKESGAHYVKTSTGFHAAGGATAEAVALMRLVVGDSLGVKASGGVRDCATALRMIANGATRVGTSSGVAMAKCLGPGPLPVGELLSLAAAHGGTCACGSCARDGHEAPAAGATGAPGKAY
jgi:deoxyribose-phosphate aldolase